MCSMEAELEVRGYIFVWDTLKPIDSYVQRVNRILKFDCWYGCLLMSKQIFFDEAEILSLPDFYTIFLLITKTAKSKTA